MNFVNFYMGMRIARERLEDETINSMEHFKKEYHDEDDLEDNSMDEL